MHNAVVCMLFMPSRTIFEGARDHHDLLLIREIKHCAWNVPSGYVERDEHALEAARREFREETGYSCPEITSQTELRTHHAVVYLWETEHRLPSSLGPYLQRPPETNALLSIGLNKLYDVLNATSPTSATALFSPWLLMKTLTLRPVFARLLLENEADIRAFYDTIE